MILINIWRNAFIFVSIWIAITIGLVSFGLDCACLASLGETYCLFGFIAICVGSLVMSGLSNYVWRFLEISLYVTFKCIQFANMLTEHQTFIRIILMCLMYRTARHKHNLTIKHLNKNKIT